MKIEYSTNMKCNCTNYAVLCITCVILLLYVVKLSAKQHSENNVMISSILIDLNKTLVVIGDDRSGSTTHINKLSEEDYIRICESVNISGGGTIAVKLIGHPKPSLSEPMYLSLDKMEPLTPFDPRDRSKTLTERGAIKAKNERQQAENKKIEKRNSEKIFDFVSGKVKPNVIEYKPGGNDHTDLDDAFLRINTLIAEPQFNDYDRVIVVIISDGHNQPGKARKPVSKRIVSKHAEVYLVGWDEKVPVNCFEVKKIERFSNKEGMIEYLTK